MDPNATLRALDSLDSGDDHELTAYAGALAGWLDSGGFEPDWAAYPHGTGLYRAWQAGCAIVPFRAHLED